MTLPTPRKDEPRSATPPLIRNGSRPPSAMEIIEMVRGDLAWMRYKQDYSDARFKHAENLLTEALVLLRDLEDDGR